MLNREIIMPAEKHIYLDQWMRSWITNTARKQHWRIASWYALDDLTRMVYLCYAKCWDRYRELFDVSNPPKSNAVISCHWFKPPIFVI